MKSRLLTVLVFLQISLAQAQIDQVFHTAYKSNSPDNGGSDPIGSVQDYVNLYTGDLNMPLNVLTLNTEIGLPISVSFTYNSNVDLSVLKWNKEQDDGVLGHAWSFDYPKITVDDRSTGTRIDDIFYLVDGGSNELICIDKGISYQVDGIPTSFQAKAFKTKNFSPYTFYYIEDLERWEVWREGKKYIFGGKTEFPTAVQWGAHWGNWIGSSNNSTDIEEIGIVWNLAKIENQAGLWLEYSYLNREAQITTSGSETNTVSSLLTKIEASSGEYVDLLYESKSSSWEYYDPNSQASYQDRFTSDYLSSIAAYGKNGNLRQKVNLGYSTYTGQYAKRLLATVTNENQHGHESQPLKFDYYSSSARISTITSPDGAVRTVTYGNTTMDHLVQSFTRPSGYDQQKVWSLENYTVVAYRNAVNMSTKFFVYWWDGQWKNQELFDIDVYHQKVTEESYGMIELDDLDIKFEQDHFAFTHHKYGSNNYWFARAFLEANGTWQTHIENNYAADLPQVVTGLNFAGIVRRLASTTARMYTRGFDSNWTLSSINMSIITGNRSATGMNNYFFVHANNGSDIDQVQLFYLDEERVWNTDGSKDIPYTVSDDYSTLYASQSFIYLVISDDSFQDHGLKIISWDEGFNLPINSLGNLTISKSIGGYIQDVKLYGNKLFYLRYYDPEYNLQFKVGRFNGTSWIVEDRIVNSFGDDVYYAANGYYATYSPISESWTSTITDPQNNPNRFAGMLQNSMFRHYTIGLDDHNMVYYYRQNDGTYSTSGLNGPSGDSFDNYADGGYLSGHTNYFVNDGKITFKQSGTFYQQAVVQTDAAWADHDVEESYYGPNSFVTHSGTAGDDLVFNKLIKGYYGKPSAGSMVVKPVSEVSFNDGFNTVTTQFTYDETNKRYDEYGRAAFDQVTVTHGSGNGYTVHKFFNGNVSSGAGFGNESTYYSFLKGLKYETLAYDDNDVEVSRSQTGYEVVDSYAQKMVTVPRTDFRQDNINISTYYEYNEKFQKSETRFSNYDFSSPGITRTYTTENKYIWEDVAYNSEDIGLFGAVIQQKTTVTRMGQTFKVGASAVRWSDWSGILAPETSYQWNGATSLDFTEFNSSIDPSGWQRSGTIVSRDALGRSTQVENIDGIVSSAYYMSNYSSPHMTVMNAELDESFFDDFNDEDDSDWFGGSMSEQYGYMSLPTGSNNIYHSPLSAGSVSSNVEFSMRFPSASSSTNAGYVFNKSTGGSTYNSGSNISLRIDASSSQVILRVYKGTSLLKSGTLDKQNVQNKWHQYQIRYFDHATNPWIDVYVDGELVVDNAYLGSVNSGITYRSFYSESTITEIDHYRVYPHDAYAVSSSVNEDRGYLEQTMDASGLMTSFLYNSWGGMVASVDVSNGLPVTTTQSASSTKYNETFNASDPGRILSTSPTGEEGFVDDFTHDNTEWFVNSSSASRSSWAVTAGSGVLENNITGNGLTPSGHGYFINWGSEIKGKVSFEFDLWADELISAKQLGFAAGGNSWNYSSTGSEIGVLSYMDGSDFKTNNGSINTHISNIDYTQNSVRIKLTIDTESDQVLIYLDGKQLALESTKSAVSGIQKFGFINYGLNGSSNTWFIDNFIMYVDGIESQVMFDASGKTLQAISRSFDDQLMITENIYDALGRNTASTKATKINNSLMTYKPALVTSYNYATGVTTGDVATINGESHITANTLFDDSPLSRIVSAGSPGLEYDAFSANASTFEYGSNTLNTSSDFYMGSGVGSANVYRAKKATNPDGWKQVSFYDRMGNLVMTKTDEVEVTDQSGNNNTSRLTTEYVYNDQGLVSEIRPPNYFNNPGTGPVEDWATYFSYDALGRVTSKSSPDEGVITYVYDQAGRVLFSQNDRGFAEGFVNYYRYDELGRSLEQGYWNTTTPINSMDESTIVPTSLSTWRVRYSYEWPGRLVKKEVNNDENIDADASEIYSHDKYGRIVEVTQYTYDYDATPHTIKYEYDQMGRTVKILYPDTYVGNQVVSGQVITEAINLSGDEIEISNSSVESGGSLNISAGTSVILKPGFWAKSGSVFTASTGNEGETAVTYHYYDNGSIQSVGTDTDEDRFASYVYDINGALSEENLDNDVINRTFSYDVAGHLTSIEDQWFEETLNYTSGGYSGFQSHAGLISGTSFSFKSAQWTGAAKPANYSYQFDYDKRGRMKSANHTVQNNFDMGVGTSIKYDANGNFITLKKGSSTKNYAYNSGTNQVNSLNGGGSTQYFYDEIGNITQSVNKDLDNIEYDEHMNLTTTIQRSVGGGTYLTHLAYGPGGRVYKKDQAQGGSSYVETMYQRGLSSNPLIERYKDHTGTKNTVKYIYGPTGLIATHDGSNYNFVLKDHLGSTRVVLSDEGSVKSVYNYSPFGELITNTVGENGSHKFTGQEYDEETGLHNLNARLYDSELGRFYANDPMSTLLSSWSGYHYAYNSPNVYSDRSGMFPCPAWDADCDGMADSPRYNDPNCATPDCSQRRNSWDPGSMSSTQWIANSRPGGASAVERMAWQLQAETAAAVASMNEQTITIDGKTYKGQFTAFGTRSYLNGELISEKIDGYTFQSSGGNPQVLYAGFAPGEDLWNTVSNWDNGLGFVVGGASESLGRYLHSRANPQNMVGWNKTTGTSIETLLVKGVPVNRSFLNGAAKTLKVGGAALGFVGLGMTGYEIYTGQKSFIGEGGLDLIMGGVAFIPGGGWIVSGAYFGGKALLEYTGNDFWNEP
ncbi:RHS repeat domain-containing protein [Marinoscillum sp.]|uniref:RHS repeat domain-containing protein n=1 Tax=Marinoscillum sp. TaxID=2024838 RepID=UPI003BA9EB5E